MPIKIPNNLPAYEILEQERVAIIRQSDAVRQDIRPLQVAILNLMPDKISTETQLLRVLGTTPLQLEVTLLRTDSYVGKNTSKEHLSTFYKVFSDIKAHKFDALIVTGAPVETLDFEKVDYWAELTEILEWSKSNVFSSMFICWGAQAALHHFHGVPKHEVSAKKFGVFKHHVVKPFDPIITGFDDHFHVPVSRHTEVRHEDIAAIEELEVLASSEDSGLCLVSEPTARRVYMFNHLEYDAETLKGEYKRDIEAGTDVNIPHNYFPDDDPTKEPYVSWRAHRNLLFGNWINMVYQGTPYNLDDL